MREPAQAIVNALERDVGGIAIIWCPDLGLRDWLVGEVASLTSAEPVCVSDVEAAIAEPDRCVLLVPRNEREVVLDLDGSRDRLRSEERPRTAPIVLFLLDGGDGQAALAEAPSLASWAHGNGADPEALARIDVEEARGAFRAETGETPEEWLRRWRSEEFAHTPANFRNYYRALLVEHDEAVG